MQLFRPESMRSQDRLHGEVDLAPPTSWQTIGFGLVAAFTIAILFLSFARYSQVATAQGRITDSNGAVEITTSGSGTVDAVLVRDGQRVRRGQPLITVSHDTIANGDSLERRRAAAIQAETNATQARGVSAREASRARIAGLEARRRSAEAEARGADEQIQQQRELITAADDDLRRARVVAERGFVSQQDIRRREEALADRRQGMSRLVQASATARASADEATQGIAQERADNATMMSEIAGTVAQTEGKAASSDNARTTVITAGADGVVSNVTATRGMMTSAGAVMMSIVPPNSSLVVRLSIPDSAVVSIAPGQRASIAVDAFPYQVYGTVEARIEDVSTAAVLDGDRKGFVATARLAGKTVRAYGVDRPLRPGMTVSARIRTMDRTLLQWLLDPLYAVSRR